MAVHARYREALRREPGSDNGLDSYISRQPLPGNNWHEWHHEEVAHSITSDSLRKSEADSDALAKELNLTRRENEQLKLSLDKLGNEFQVTRIKSCNPMIATSSLAGDSSREQARDRRAARVPQGDIRSPAETRLGAQDDGGLEAGSQRGNRPDGRGLALPIDTVKPRLDVHNRMA